MVSCIVTAMVASALGFVAGSLLAGAKHGDQALQCLAVVDAARQFSKKYAAQLGDTSPHVTVDKGDLERLRTSVESLDHSHDDHVAPQPAQGMHTKPGRSHQPRHSS